MLRVYNSLSRTKEEFVPVHPGHVGMYVCGPTVYDYPHLGHAKSYVSFDVIVRYLRHLGFAVRYVQNITDVGHLTDDADEGEDKIVKRAARERLQPMELVELYTREYFTAMDALNVLRPDISPRASAHVPEIVETCQLLIEKGFAYASEGSVYFDVARFSEYGKLSNRRPEDQEAGVRIEVATGKHHAADFALWKHAEPGHILRWHSPWGDGYPGWHIECSVMSMKYLGDTLDIHGGGIEHLFPHHEDEIAQSEAATGHPFVKYWIHNGLLNIDGVKMSKSLGNFITMRDALQRWPALLIRFFLLGTHYRSTVDFADHLVEDAGRGLSRLQSAVWNLDQAMQKPAEQSPAADDASADLLAAAQEATEKFTAAMDDDFNTPGALAALFDLASDTNRLLATPGKAVCAGAAAARAAFDQLGGVLGLQWEPRRDVSEGLAGRLMDLVMAIRQDARDRRDWATSDRIRDALREAGVIVEDRVGGGSTWRVA